MSAVQTVVLLENSPTPAYLIEPKNVVYTEGMSGAVSTAVAQAAAANADADAAAAHVDRLAADADVIATVAAKLQAIVAKNSAETAASSAGTDLAAILAAIGGSTWAGALTIQVASRTALGVLSGMTAGTQVYLSERGYEGPFEFVAGNQSAQITADPYHALWIAPTAAATGASGAWRRIHNGEAQASWAGVIASGIGDYSAQLIALLGHADVWAVELQGGTIGVATGIPVPSGKTLFGKGIGSTILKATATTGYTAGTGSHQNAIAYAASGSVGVRIHDFTAEGNKLGTHLIGGVHAIRSKQFIVQRVYARNCSGYAFWSVTDAVYTLDATSGVFRNCWAENSNVSFEATASQNILFDRCHARDGDADIPGGIETMLHPITGSKKITYRDCTAITSHAGSVAHCATYTAEPIEDILFENCYIQANSGVVAAAVDAYSAAIRRVRFVDCYVESTDYFGIYSTDPGPFGVDISVENGTVKALAQGISLYSSVGSLRVSGTKIIVRQTSGAGQVSPIAVADGCHLTIDGPEFDTDRAFSYPQVFPSGANVSVVAPPVIRVPQATLAPLGEGHRLAYILPADETHSSGLAVIGSGASVFSISALEPGTFRVHVDGAYQAGATTNGISLWVEASGPSAAASGVADIDTHSDGSGRVHGIIRGAASIINSASVGTANTPFPFVADFIWTVVDTGGGGLTISAGAYDGSGFGGTLQINKATTLTIERIA